MIRRYSCRSSIWCIQVCFCEMNRSIYSTHFHAASHQPNKYVLALFSQIYWRLGVEDAVENDQHERRGLMTLTSLKMVAIAYKQKLGWPRYYRNYLIIGTFAIISIAAFIIVLPFFLAISSDDYLGKKILESLLSPTESILNSKEISESRHSCDYHSCFNIYKCGKNGNDKILVYVYPHVKHVDDQGIPITNSVSIEFYDIIKTIIESEYYTPNPKHACIFVPSLDTLNQNRLRLSPTSKVLAALPLWVPFLLHLLMLMCSLVNLLRLSHALSCGEVIVFSNSPSRFLTSFWFQEGNYNFKGNKI